MDETRFDDITKSLANGADRRSVVKRLAGGVLGGLVAIGASRVGADAHKKKKKCIRSGDACTEGGKKCCNGNVCVGGVCTAPPPPPPPPSVCGNTCNPKNANRDCSADPECTLCRLRHDTIDKKRYQCVKCQEDWSSCKFDKDCCGANTGTRCTWVTRGGDKVCKPPVTCNLTQECTSDDDCGKGCECRRSYKFKDTMFCGFEHYDGPYDN